MPFDQPFASCLQLFLPSFPFPWSLLPRRRVRRGGRAEMMTRIVMAVLSDDDGSNGTPLHETRLGVASNSSHKKRPTRRGDTMKTTNICFAQCNGRSFIAKIFASTYFAAMQCTFGVRVYVYCNIKLTSCAKLSLSEAAGKVS